MVGGGGGGGGYSSSSTRQGTDPNVGHPERRGFKKGTLKGKALLPLVLHDCFLAC